MIRRLFRWIITTITYIIPVCILMIIKKKKNTEKTYEKLGYKYDSESKDKKENKEESLDAK